jgi:hypothetical protein
MGVIEVESLDNRKLRRSPLVKKLWAAYRALLWPAHPISTGSSGFASLFDVSVSGS